ncbi:MAG: gfo/Idh/MocA family oxidoreductase, partial [Candidatus Neomarinimicrobiota bacterium]
MVKIGVVGAGHLGKMHIKNLNNIPEVDFVGFYDSDKQRANKISEELNSRSFDSLNALLEKCDGVSIVVPTVSHYDVALAAINKKVHIFCEKPFMQTIEEADEIIELAGDNNIVLQVGHIERFNPALASLEKIAINPLFIESHRISSFHLRGTDVAVILDLM